jgi:hypothetical protein
VALLRLSPLVVVFQPFAHTYDVVDCVADAAVEFDDVAIGSANLQIDLGAAGFAEQALGFGNNGAGKPAPLKLGRDGEVIEPTAMALITGHYAGDDLTVEQPNQKEVGSDAKFALNVTMRIVPGPDQITELPQGYDCFFIV